MYNGLASYATDAFSRQLMNFIRHVKNLCVPCLRSSSLPVATVNSSWNYYAEVPVNGERYMLGFWPMLPVTPPAIMKWQKEGTDEPERSASDDDLYLDARPFRRQEGVTAAFGDGYRPHRTTTTGSSGRQACLAGSDDRDRLAFAR